MRTNMCIHVPLHICMCVCTSLFVGTYGFVEWGMPQSDQLTGQHHQRHPNESMEATAHFWFFLVIFSKSPERMASNPHRIRSGGESPRG